MKIVILRAWLLAVLLAAAPGLCTAAFAENDPPFDLPPPPELLRIRSAVLETSKGSIYIRLFPEAAPWHVANFKYLADRGFYRNLPFHLYEPGFAIQTGAPGPQARSGPGYTLPPEFNKQRHEPGSLTMVRKPNDLDLAHTRRSHGSQFRIMIRSAPEMDGKYVVFGKVVKGMEVVESLRLGDVIKNLQVFVKAEEAADRAPNSAAGLAEPRVPGGAGMPPSIDPF